MEVSILIGEHSLHPPSARPPARSHVAARSSLLRACFSGSVAPWKLGHHPSRYCSPGACSSSLLGPLALASRPLRREVWPLYLYFLQRRPRALSVVLVRPIISRYFVKQPPRAARREGSAQQPQPVGKWRGGEMSGSVRLAARRGPSHVSGCRRCLSCG